MSPIASGGGSSGGSTPTLSQVLTTGNSAGTSTVNMNSNKITSVANGTTGTDGAALGQTFRAQQRDLGIGFSGTSYDLALVLSQNSLASQFVIGSLVGLVAGDVVTNIIPLVTTAGSGTTPTNIYVAIYKTDGTRQAVSNDLHASAIWTSTGFAVAALSGAFTVTTTGAYYFCVLTNGTWGTTQMQIGKTASDGISGLQFQAQLSSGPSLAVNQSGQSSMPANATFAHTQNAMFWFGWS